MTRQQEKAAVVYGFLDTNVFLHYQLFDEVDWPSVLGVQQVCLVLSPVVTRELDRFKEDARSPWRKQRARTVLAKIDALLPDPAVETPAAVRAQVTLYELGSEPQIAWDAERLDPTIPDDRLIASILDFTRTHPTAEVRLVSADRGPLRTARRHGVVVVNPTDKVRKLEPTSEESKLVSDLQRRLLETQHQVQALEHRIPHVTVGFWDDGVAAPELTLAASRDLTSTPAAGAATPEEETWSDQRVSALLAHERQQIDATLRRAPADAAAKDVQVYTKHAEEYLAAFQDYVRMRWSFEAGCPCALTFVLENTGAIEATDIRVDLFFPAGAFVFDPSRDDHDRVERTQPHRPVAEWMRPKDPWGLLPHAPVLALPHIPATPQPPRRRGPLYDTYGDRSVVTYEAPKLFAGTRWVMPELVAHMLPDAAGRVVVAYRVVANGLPAPVEGQLVVRWSESPVAP